MLKPQQLVEHDRLCRIKAARQLQIALNLRKFHWTPNKQKNILTRVIALGQAQQGSEGPGQRSIAAFHLPRKVLQIALALDDLKPRRVIRFDTIFGSEQRL